MDAIFEAIKDELVKADNKYNHDPMKEAKVGVLTIECELAELKREVARDHARMHLMRKEAIQVAAMACKFLRDICKGVGNGIGN